MGEKMGEKMGVQMNEKTADQNPPMKPWQWIGAATGALVGLGDVAFMLWVGVEMDIAGKDGKLFVLSFIAANYGLLGYVIGRLMQARIRARHDAATIALQLQALERACPGYKMPPPGPDEVPVRPTQFDLSRQASLDVNVRGLDEMLAGLVAELRRRQMI